MCAGTSAGTTALISDYRVVRSGQQRLRIGPWRGDTTVGYVAPLSPASTLDARGVQTALSRLGQLGYASVVTAALSHVEQRPFAALGFDVHDRLHLLEHDLTDIPPARELRTRRGYRWHHPQILEIDHRAFSGFWRLDHAALLEAIEATPTRRVRIAEVDGSFIGYAITGRAESYGYLQRLAIDPAYAGHNYGAALVVDALRWAQRRGCRSLAVNTQETNLRALSLYERLGFRRMDQGLAVLKLDTVS